MSKRKTTKRKSLTRDWISIRLPRSFWVDVQEAAKSRAMDLLSDPTPDNALKVMALMGARGTILETLEKL